jgi:hypothetical protein
MEYVMISVHVADKTSPRVANATTIKNPIERSQTFSIFARGIYVADDMTLDTM